MTDAKAFGRCIGIGGVVLFPSDTVYGLGCDLFNKKAVDRLYQIKGIDKAQMLAFVCQNLGEVARYAISANVSLPGG